MRYLVLLLSALLGTTSVAGAAPRLTLSAYQVAPGTSIVIQAAGFTPGSIVISHLVRPDGTEYPTMTFEADTGGTFSHTIVIVPAMVGTYEVRMTDRDSRVSTSARFMMVAVGTPPPPAGSGAGAMPAGHLGVWEGDVAQRATAAPASAVIALTAGDAGAVVGTVVYPSLLCGGELWLMGVQDGAIRLGESITYGTERCTGDGIVTATLTPDGRLGYEWRNAHDPAPQAVASGTLERRK